jgi:hypothetical protein
MWIDSIKGATAGETSLQVAPKPIRLEAAMANSFMKEKEVQHIVRKIAASLESVTFPMTIDLLDGVLRDYALTTGERICLKAALSRAGLLR